MAANKKPRKAYRPGKVTTDLLAQGCALMPGWSQSAEAMEAFRTGIPCRPLNGGEDVNVLAAPAAKE